MKSFLVAFVSIGACTAWSSPSSSSFDILKSKGNGPVTPTVPVDRNATEITDLHAVDGKPFDAFGVHLVANEQFVAVSSAPKKAPGGSRPKVYLFKKTSEEEASEATAEGSTFRPTAVLASVSIKAHDGFGCSLAMASDCLLVGADNHDSHMKDSGAVYTYLNNDLNGYDMLPGHFQIVTPSFVYENARFGASVSGSGDMMLVGAPGDQFDTMATGSAYLFAFDSQSKRWSEISKFGPDSSLTTTFGRTVAVHGSIAAVSALENISGVVYLIDISSNETASVLLPSQCSTDTTFGYTLAMSTGRLLASGHDQQGGGIVYVFDLSHKSASLTAHLNTILEPMEASSGAVFPHYGAALYLMDLPGDKALISGQQRTVTNTVAVISAAQSTLEDALALVSSTDPSPSYSAKSSLYFYAAYCTTISTVATSSEPTEGEGEGGEGDAGSSASDDPDEDESATDVSTSNSTSFPTSNATSLPNSTSFSDSNTTSLSDSNTTSFSDSNTTAFSDSNNTSFSDSNTTSLSDSNTTSLSDSNTTSFSDSNTTSLSDSNTTSFSDSNTTSLSDSNTTSFSNSNTTSLSDSNTTSLSDSNTTTTTTATSTSASTSTSTPAVSMTVEPLSHTCSAWTKGLKMDFDPVPSEAAYGASIAMTNGYKDILVGSPASTSPSGNFTGAVHNHALQLQEALPVLLDAIDSATGGDPTEDPTEGTDSDSKTKTTAELAREALTSTIGIIAMAFLPVAAIVTMLLVLYSGILTRHKYIISAAVPDVNSIGDNAGNDTEAVGQEVGYATGRVRKSRGSNDVVFSALADGDSSSQHDPSALQNASLQNTSLLRFMQWRLTGPHAMLPEDEALVKELRNPMHLEEPSLPPLHSRSRSYTRSSHQSSKSMSSIGGGSVVQSSKSMSSIGGGSVVSTADAVSVGSMNTANSRFSVPRHSRSHSTSKSVDGHEEEYASSPMGPIMQV